MKTPDPSEKEHLLAEDLETDNERADDIENKSIFDVPSKDPLFKETLQKLFFGMIPVGLTAFVTFFNQTITMHFLKAQNDIIVTGSYGLAGSVQNIAFLVLFLSLSLGLITCAGHAYGARNYELVGLYYHRALIIHFLVCIPCVCCFYWSDKICLMLNFDPRIAFHIHELLLYSIPGMFAQLFFTTTVAYLNACGVFTVPGLIPPFGCLIYWAFGYFLIERLDLGIVGAAICYDIQAFFLAISIFVYVKVWNPIPNTFFCPCKASFTGIWRLFKIEVSTGSMLYLEWIAFEIIQLFAGRLENKVQLAGITIVFAQLTLVTSIPFGLREVTMAYVSHDLGEKNVKKAKMCLKAGLVLTTIITIILIIYFIFFSRVVIGFYTNDLAVIEQTAEYFWFFVLLLPSDVTQCVLGSGIRALRKDREGTILMLIGYYLAALPVAYVLCFTINLGGLGLLLGIIAGSYCILVGLSIIFYTVDWDKQIRIITEETETGNNTLEFDKP